MMDASMDDAMDASMDDALRAFAAMGRRTPREDMTGADGPMDGPMDETTDEPSDAAPASFDVDEFLRGLDAIFDAHDAPTKAGPYLEQAMVDAENAGDDAGLLTVLNETMGFYRSQSRHRENQWIVQRAMELALRMGLEGTEAWATTLINCATAMRAAGCHNQAEELYRQALDCAEHVFKPTDRRLAALHNNLSMLYDETGRTDLAERELREALRLVTAASVDPGRDIDVASSHANLALLLARADRVDEAASHAEEALAIYQTGGLEHSAHYASVLASLAQVRHAQGRLAESEDLYVRALAVIEECYGDDNDYHRVTASNLAAVREELSQARTRSDAQGDAQSDTDTDTGERGDAARSPISAPSDAPSVEHRSGMPHSDAAMSGLALARAYWRECGRPMLQREFPDYVGRVAVGLVGHGSECLGFDDRISQDHDFGPRFCMWLTDADYAAIGEDLQRAYDALPASFRGFARVDSADGVVTPRARGAFRRDGVFRIGAFFEALTGCEQAPSADMPHVWLSLDEATLATATGGEVFVDPLGAFSRARQDFKDMPEDVRLSLVSRRLGMAAQAGQANLPRCLERGDGAAAWLCVGEFVDACASLVFLLNTPMVAGYAPYYKWRFAALRRLSSRPFARLAGVCARLETVMRLASAACFGGEGFGEGGKGSGPAVRRLLDEVDAVAADVVRELRRQGLTSSDERFLEWQRPYVEEHIRSDAACLRSL